MSQPVIVLLVEDNSTHAHLITRHLEKTTDVVLSLHHQESLIGAFEFLSQHACDAVLLDLSLPDSEIRDTLPRFFGAHADIPVIVLTSLDDIEFATSAVQQGAQDYLVKSDLSGQLLIRAIRNAIERKKTSEGNEVWVSSTSANHDSQSSQMSSSASSRSST